MTIEITDEMVDTVGQEVYGDTWEPRHDHIGTWQAHNVHAALTAALPIIEKQVREQCAAEIEAAIDEDAPGKVHNDPVIYMRNIGFQRGLKYATRIIRALDGDTS